MHEKTQKFSQCIDATQTQETKYIKTIKIVIELLMPKIYK